MHSTRTYGTNGTNLDISQGRQSFLGKAHVKSFNDKFERIEMRAPIDGSFTGIRVHDAMR
jgi:hypothetical protein